MKRILLAVLAGLIVLVVFDFPGDDASREHASPISATSGGGSESAAPTRGGAVSQLMEKFVFRKRALIGESQGPLFGSHGWQPLPPITATATAPPPVAPPMSYKFSGASVYNGQLQVFLTKGDAIIPISLGETIEGGYRVEAIDERQITLSTCRSNRTRSFRFPHPCRLPGHAFRQRGTTQPCLRMLLRAMQLLTVDCWCSMNAIRTSPRSFFGKVRSK